MRDKFPVCPTTQYSERPSDIPANASVLAIRRRHSSRGSLVAGAKSRVGTVARPSNAGKEMFPEASGPALVSGPSSSGHPTALSPPRPLGAASVPWGA